MFKYDLLLSQSIDRFRISYFRSSFQGYPTLNRCSTKRFPGKNNSFTVFAQGHQPYMQNNYFVECWLMIANAYSLIKRQKMILTKSEQFQPSSTQQLIADFKHILHSIFIIELKEAFVFRAWITQKTVTKFENSQSEVFHKKMFLT